MTDSLVERLREEAGGHRVLRSQAADAIEASLAREERLRSALEFFVKACDEGPANMWVHRMNDCYRTARAALGESK